MVRKQLLLTALVFFVMTSETAKAVEAARKPAMAAPRALAGNAVMPPKKKIRPASKPVEPATQIDLPKTVALYPAAKAVPFQPYHSNDNRSYLVGQFATMDPIEKVNAYFSPKVVDELGQNGMKIRPIEPQYKFAQGWFTKERRGLYLFRVYLVSNGKQTDIKYYMERAR